MKARIKVVHDIKGRLRIIIPALGDKKHYHEIEKMFSSLKGIKNVRIEPLIQSMVIEYTPNEIEKTVLLTYVSIFFEQTQFDPIDNLMVRVTPAIRKDLFRSLISGFLLLMAYMRKTVSPRPDLLDYAVVISTGYTVLSHGNQGNNRFGHPDIITGVISLLSLGTQNILHVSFVTWLVNLIEIFHDMYKSRVAY